ncbi:hypothetical protein JCM1840_002746, partial [Sporobolomyces johnsonii]
MPKCPRHSSHSDISEETTDEEEEGLPHWSTRDVKDFFESKPVFRRPNDDNGPFEPIIRDLNGFYVHQWLGDPRKSRRLFSCMGSTTQAYRNASVNMSSFPCCIASIVHIKAVSGVSPATLEKLNRRGVQTMSDLCQAINSQDAHTFFAHEPVLHVARAKVVALHEALQLAVDARVSGALRGKTSCHDIDMVTVAEHAREDDLHLVRDFVLESWGESGQLPSRDYIWQKRDQSLPDRLEAKCPCSFHGVPFGKGVVHVSSGLHPGDPSPASFRFDLAVSHPAFLRATLMRWTSGRDWLESLHRYCVDEHGTALSAAGLIRLSTRNRARDTPHEQDIFDFVGEEFH